MALRQKIRTLLPWLPVYLWQRIARHTVVRGPVHLIIALADHSEPSYVPNPPGGYAEREVQDQRLERWCKEYPMAVRDWRDHDGFPFRHTYFYPAEQYDKGLLDRPAEHCHALLWRGRNPPAPRAPLRRWSAKLLAGRKASAGALRKPCPAASRWWRHVSVLSRNWSRMATRASWCRRATPERWPREFCSSSATASWGNAWVRQAGRPLRRTST